ncbi:DNA polymerase II [Paraglaciecola aquimarina]|uniref:DNA polymerase n=1 Tax=Paraglaciecola algarum TaxID=3050085 RepID=A0ABS9D9T7_9ALTE|nr:DNA polymerase II [Paraglaciecola sp. G1-23]
MQSPIDGFILTANVIEQQNKSYLEFWLLTEQGPIQAITPSQKYLFFIPQTTQEMAANLLQQAKIEYLYKNLELTTFDHTPVGGLYFDSHKQFYKAKVLLKQNNIRCFEDDIRLPERYMMERFIYASATVSGLSDQAEFPSAQQKPFMELSQAHLKPSQYIPKFKLLSLDIECSEKGQLFSIGLATEAEKSVIMIGQSKVAQEDPDKKLEDWIIWVEDEKSLLISFVQKLNEYDPDVIIGWNVVNFDFRLLIKRAALHNVPLKIGRSEQVITWRNARNESNQGYVSMPGRMVVDGIDALKTATYQFDSFSLENVSQNLLGVGKDTENVDDRLAQIQYDFLHNKVKLAKYNLQDCELVLQIFAHTKVLEFLTLRSQLTGLELDRMGGSVAAFINLYLPKLHRAGYVSPNRPADGGLASPGGYVMDSKPGLYTNVLVLDFKSLYPSIIRTFKIDPLGLVEGLKQDDNSIQGFLGAKFSRDKHFLPDIITSLWQQRDQAKLNKDAARSQAIKILMNSFYGVLGSGGCPFYDTRLASSITMRGHEIMQVTASWIEQAGYEVIYGDTDSTFVWLKGEFDNQQVQQIGTALAEQINQKWTEKIQHEHQLDSDLEIEFETHFSQFLMPTIRGSEKGSKKRYAGLKVNSNSEQLIFKGLENVRSDWTDMAKQFQLTLYKMVFAKQAVEEFVQQVVADIRHGKCDGMLVYRKRIRRKLSLYVKNVPPHVRAARLADERNARLGKTLKYQNKSWVSYVMTLNGPEPLEYLSSKIDYDHYIEKQIQPIAEGILPFINKSFENISSQQLGLF